MPEIIYFYDRPDSSTFRYRVLHALEAAKVAGKEGLWFTPTQFMGLPPLRRHQVLKRASVVVLVRTRFSPDMLHIVSESRHYDCLVVGDVDDLVFEPEKVPQIMEALSVPHTEDRLDYWCGYTSRIQLVLQMCDIFTASTPEVGQALTRNFGKQVVLFPNFSGTDDINRASVLLSSSREQPRGLRVDLAYFSGTPSHARDFDIAAQGIVSIMRSDPHVHLTLVGYLEIPHVFDSLMARVHVLPPLDVSGYWKAMADVDVHLAPLRKSEFTEAKSALKFFEAALLRKIVVASNLPAFRRLVDVQHDRSGWLADELDWEQNIEAAVAEVRYPTGVAFRAREWALRHSVPKAHAGVFSDIFAMAAKAK